MSRYVAVSNPGIPRQSELIDKIVATLGTVKGDKTVLLVPYMEDLYFKADGSYPANIEQGILAVEDAGITPKFPVSKADGPTKMDVLPVTVPAGNFPFLVNLEIAKWPSPEALDALDHELVHVVQWLGTGLIRVVEGDSIVAAFTQTPGDVVFGAPKKKYRTYQRVPEILPTSVKGRLGLELSLDEEFMAYGRTFAQQVAKSFGYPPTREDIHLAVERYFDDLLASSLVGVPGSARRWEGQKKLVRNLLEEQYGLR